MANSEANKRTKHSVIMHNLCARGITAQNVMYVMERLRWLADWSSLPPALHLATPFYKCVCVYKYKWEGKKKGLFKLHSISYFVGRVVLHYSLYFLFFVFLSVFVLFFAFRHTGQNNLLCSVASDGDDGDDGAYIDLTGIVWIPWWSVAHDLSDSRAELCIRCDALWWDRQAQCLAHYTHVPCVCVCVCRFEFVKHICVNKLTS